ncbi:MAG: hypothetical protein IT379_12705 [Deltaproteobacteria bacterium]|nr:hypothetical protein [Deltaproteobacteria bacterium]
MTYRDDREALHARTASLEAELADAQRELSLLRARNALASEEAESLRGTIDRLSFERRAATPPPFVRPRPWWVWAYVSAVLLGMMSFVAFAGSTRRATMYPVGAYVPRPMHAMPPPVDLGVLARVPHEPARVELPAKVTDSTGRRLRPGTECTVRAEVGRAAGGLDAKIDVECPNDDVLYRWSDVLGGGVGLRECRAYERETADGEVRYAFDCRDEGARTSGRPQLRLETAGARLDVWMDEGAEPFRVSFEVPELSSAWNGRPLLGDELRRLQAFVPFDREGRVSRVTGRGAPAAMGDSCSVRVEAPIDSRFNCRAFVRCGGELLYGAGSTGYMVCSLDEERPVTGSDTGISDHDGDAMAELDLVAGRVVLGDRGPDGSWSLVVSLD